MPGTPSHHDVEPAVAVLLRPDEVVEALKALANPMRWQIIQWLGKPEVAFAQWEQPVGDRTSPGVCGSHIQAKSGLSQSTVSAYMGALERAGLVRSTRIGKWTYFRRDEDRLRAVGRALSD